MKLYANAGGRGKNGERMGSVVHSNSARAGAERRLCVTVCLFACACVCVCLWLRVFSPVCAQWFECVSTRLCFFACVYAYVCLFACASMFSHLCVRV